MPNYKELYYTLFNSITDVIEQLKEIQQNAEELYISREQIAIIKIENDKHKEISSKKL